MTSRYFDSASGDNQYYFNSSSATTSHSVQNYNASSAPSYGTPVFSSYQSAGGGFGRGVSSPLPAPQVRASVRVLGSQDSYALQTSPQQHHFQFDSRQQPGRPSGPAVVYQTPGAAQYTHHNVDLWTEGPSRGSDYYVQAQRVPVRPASSSSPQRQPDSLQHYYSQLTPEQHQQLLRQQQIQRQQQQQQQQERRVIVQQTSPSSSSYHHQQQQQQRSTASFAGGQSSPQGRSRSESERQRQNEQDFYSAQRQMAMQRAQQDDEESYRPVGIRNLMNKFAPPATIQQRPPRSRSTTTRHNSSSNYNSYPGSNQTTTTRSYASHTMTYSDLPKSHEPPVNSAEYYQLQQLMGSPFTSIQQAAAPVHIQQAHSDLSSLRDRFKTGSLSDDFSRPMMMMNRQAPPPQQQQRPMQRQTSMEGGSNLNSLRSQYMNRAKEASQDDLPAQQAYSIPRTILGEDFPPPKPQQQQQAPLQMQPAAQVHQKQPGSLPQPPAAAPQPFEQEEPQADNFDPAGAPPPVEGDMAVSSF